MPATIPVNKLDLKPEVSRQAAANKLPLSTPAGNVRHVGGGGIECCGTNGSTKASQQVTNLSQTLPIAIQLTVCLPAIGLRAK